MLADYQCRTAISLAIDLAEEIARAAPECASKAMQIVTILHDLEKKPDQALVHDVIEAETLSADLPEVSVRNTAAAVVRALGD